jgi:hypothetical protein
MRVSRRPATWETGDVLFGELFGAARRAIGDHLVSNPIGEEYAPEPAAFPYPPALHAREARDLTRLSVGLHGRGPYRCWR